MKKFSVCFKLNLTNLIGIIIIFMGFILDIVCIIVLNDYKSVSLICLPTGAALVGGRKYLEEKELEARLKK